MTFRGIFPATLCKNSELLKTDSCSVELACEAQTHFRSSLLSLRKIRHGNCFAAWVRRRYFRRERSDDRKCVCASQAMLSKLSVILP